MSHVLALAEVSLGAKHEPRDCLGAREKVFPGSWHQVSKLQCNPPNTQDSSTNLNSTCSTSAFFNLVETLGAYRVA